MRIGNTEVKHLEEICLREPSVDNCMAVAIQYYLDKKEDKSVEYYKKALELQSEIVNKTDISEYQEYMKLGLLYQHLNDEFNSKKIFRQVLEYLMTQPECAEITLALGNVHSLLDNDQAAILCYEKVLKEDSDNMKALESLMFIYDSYISKCRNLIKAKEIAKRILEIDPNNEMAKMDLEREDIDLDLNLGIDFLNTEKRLIIDSQDNAITDDVIKFLKSTRWWAFLIFGVTVCYIIYTLYLISANFKLN